MNISTTKPTELEDVYPFLESYRIRYYLYTEDITGNLKAAYYIAEHDDIVGLYNKRGDFLYDVGSLDPARVVEMITTERSFYNWRNYGKPRPQFNERIQQKGESWAGECLRLCAGSVVLCLTKYHPNRTYQEMKSVVENEGYLINKEGFLEPDPTKRQI